MRTLGICLGASTLTIVDLVKEADGQRMVRSVLSRSHDSDPKRATYEALSEYDLDQYDSMAATGRKFRSLVRVPGISEPEAIEHALEGLGVDHGCDAVLSIGGETFILYVLGKDGRIANAHMGNKCAAGTGEFFLQQIRRMDLDPEQALAVADPDQVHGISGRCSVFCKSDCTHALNKGHDKGEVVAGLCEMIAGKMQELVQKAGRKRILAIGGVTRNHVAMEFLRRQVDKVHIPEEAAYFEALGAATWAMESGKPFRLDLEQVFKESHTSFEMLDGLAQSKDRVTFKSMSREQAEKDDTCILGLDVGSTTTKALLMRSRDHAVLGSVYLRTNGDPVAASRACYESLASDLSQPVKIEGLGVTGSGRRIAGLHAQTETVINEIIAHAKASVFFDKDVDTIFEIGGQDAKYTFLTNGVPSDYAMNEACSAGTGSFLEESAKESLNVEVEAIADIALAAERAPNFNDQCAAFISSDIKNATHEGIAREEILAGLVYSICMNYVNRVKGARPVGSKIFMQGGVCYNRAVPVAMAVLTGKQIVVPPEPGLMGCFGAALAVKEQMELGLAEACSFDLNELAARTVEQRDPFVCSGKPENCDRKCSIRMLRVAGQTFPFGGACNKYYNSSHKKKVRTRDFNHIEAGRRELFDMTSAGSGATVGINRSLLTNIYYPLYHTFFTELGLQPVLPAAADPEGVCRTNAAFCFPMEIAHGMFKSLLDLNTDFLFLPHAQELQVPGVEHQKNTCVFVQSEGYVLQTAFKKDLNGRSVLSPRFGFGGGLAAAREIFAGMAEEVGSDRERGRRAYDKAVTAQQAIEAAAAARAEAALAAIEASGGFGVALFGRAYNAFAEEANMAIPAKFASRGIHIIPFNALPWQQEENVSDMFWAMGQINLKAAQYVYRREDLFGAFITNFSCGPDSFVLGRFRGIMGVKPSLTLELDSLTADAGIETRVEAFLDVVSAYRELHRMGRGPVSAPGMSAPVLEFKGRKSTIYMNGKHRPLQDLELVFPSMGRYTTEAFSAGAEGAGIRAVALPPADAEALKLGRGNTTCKECLPLIITTGSFLKHLKGRKNTDTVAGLFVPRQVDPCRLCQYPGFYNQLIERHKLENVVVVPLSDQDGYSGLGQKFRMHIWLALLVGDLVTDAHSALLVLAEDPDAAIAELDDGWQDVLVGMKGGLAVISKMKKLAERLSRIPLKPGAEHVPKILLTGEIYVRKDDISRQYIVTDLARRGFLVRVTPAMESVYYSNFTARTGIEEQSLKRRMAATVENQLFLISERKLRRIMGATGLCDPGMVDVEKTIACADHLVGRHIKGETSLTIGTSLREIVDHVSGIISIGPFGCMPSRVSESVLTTEMTAEGRKRATGRDMPEGIDELPFLAIESDGGAFPQITEARIEAFCLQVRRLHEKLHGE